MPAQTRDAVVDFIVRWSDRSKIHISTFLVWLGLAASTFYNWQSRYGKKNKHNGLTPRDFWLENWEKQAVIRFYAEHPTEGYRRLTYMMIDADVVAVSPTTVWRVLHSAGLLNRWNRKPSKKGTGFKQPLQPHEHWHVDIAYINIRGTFYYLCAVLDGCSRYIVHWDIRKSMTEADVEMILQRARERFPQAGPRIISDNGPQFIAKDFKEFIRISGMTHVRTSPYYPQSNGKIERWNQSVKRECVRPGTPLSLDDARRIIAEYIDRYNDIRLHSAIGYVAPKDKLDGHEDAIFADRKRKLDKARQRREMNYLSVKDSISATVDIKKNAVYIFTAG